MTGLADLALGAAPIAGGALLGVVAGNLKPPDFRGMIKSDLEMLDMLPAEDVELRTALKTSIDRRIRDLIDGTEKSRQLREIAASYRGDWRDVVLFVCAVLFTVIWWNIPHERSNWLVMFVFLIGLTVVVGIYATRGVIGALRARRRRNPSSAG